MSKDPLQRVDDLVFDQVKDRHFKLWQYYVALFALSIVPSLIPSTWLQNDLRLLLIGVFIYIARVSANVIGRVMSRNSGTDSVLIGRFFTAAPWMVGLVSTGATAILNPPQPGSLEQLVLNGGLIISGVVFTAQVLGIIIHLKKKPSMVKNIKKTDLFQ